MPKKRICKLILTFIVMFVLLVSPAAMAVDITAGNEAKGFLSWFTGSFFGLFDGFLEDSRIIEGPSLDGISGGAIKDVTGMVTVSSWQSSSQSDWGYTKLTDKNENTGWSTIGRTAPQAEWVVADLGSSCNIKGIKIRPRPLHDHLLPYNIQISVGNSQPPSSSYTAPYSFSSRGTFSSPYYIYNFNTPTQGRYIYFYFPNGQLNPVDSKYYVQMMEVIPIPAKACSDYYGDLKCGSGLSDGCGGTLNCLFTESGTEAWSYKCEYEKLCVKVNEGNPASQSDCCSGLIYLSGLKKCMQGKQAEGQLCGADADCQTGRCSGGVCASKCGSGVVDDIREECDTYDFSGTTCERLGFDYGQLLCNEDCTRYTGECQKCPTDDKCSQWEAGGVRCVSGMKQQCTALPDTNNKCFQWTTTETCGDGEICENGQCKRACAGDNEAPRNPPSREGCCQDAPYYYDGRCHASAQRMGGQCQDLYDCEEGATCISGRCTSCGNEFIDEGEECDPPNSALSCEQKDPSLLGAASCTNDCKINAANCCTQETFVRYPRTSCCQDLVIGTDGTCQTPQEEELPEEPYGITVTTGSVEIQERTPIPYPVLGADRKVKITLGVDVFDKIDYMAKISYRANANSKFKAVRNFQAQSKAGSFAVLCDKDIKEYKKARKDRTQKSYKRNVCSSYIVDYEITLPADKGEYYIALTKYEPVNSVEYANPKLLRYIVKKSS